MTDPYSNTLRMMIATDNHLGYAEKDALRGDDSFDTFEEILQLARQHEVDCLLLGGDLFHENRPTRRTLHRTMELLRHYCMGDRACGIELLSDPSLNFPSKFGTANYEDGNYNVALPVFAIHGNHDDPTGDGNLSSLDLLSTAGLLNYFGKTASVDDISMAPVLLRKGRTLLALYGLGAVRDERLHRTFLQRRVRMLRPPDAEAFFNMLVLHQNRAAHGATGYIPEHFLPSFLDLVVWGHEHECQACDPSDCAQRGFTICQPGSSVATSLSAGETKTKHVVILQLTDKQMHLLPVPLTTVRPMLMRDLVLREVRPPIEVHDARGVFRYLTAQVEAMLHIAQSQWEEQQALRPTNQRRPPPLPLIRLRVDYSAEIGGPEGIIAPPYSIVNPQRFGQQFLNRLANPRDCIHFIRRRPPSLSATKKIRETDALPGSLPKTDDAAEGLRVEDLVTQFLSSQQLDLLPQNEFCDILRIAVEKDDRDAIENFVKQSIVRSLGAVRSSTLERDVVRGEFDRSRRLREDEWQRMHPGMEALLSSRPIRALEREGDGGDDDDESSNVETSKENVPLTGDKGRGRARARGTSVAARGRSAGSNASQSKRSTGATAKTARIKQPRLDFVADEETIDNNDASIPPTPERATDEPSVVARWPSRR